VRGTVKRFFAERGYGFIRPENGPDVFVQYRGIRGKRKLLREGDEVEFEIEMGPRSPRAYNVRRTRSARKLNRRTNTTQFVRTTQPFQKISSPRSSDSDVRLQIDRRLVPETRPTFTFWQLIQRLMPGWPTNGLR
jgi:CspA family cold shock protein